MDNNEEIEGALPSEEEAGNENLESELEEGLETETDKDSNAVEEEDFDSKLEKERERLGLKIDSERKKRIEAQKNSMSREDAEKLVDERVGRLEKTMFRERAELIADRLAKSPAEKELIMLKYDHSIVPTGNIQEDIENAHALANRKQTQGRISELESSLKSKKTTSTGGSDAGQPVEQKPKQRYSQEVIDGAKFAGVTPEEFAKKHNKN